MGIRELWSILNPYCERRPLYELQGKKVAIDLSCWVCEAQNIADYQVQPRMYLRNLYFRTCYLLLMDVHPVFVLEGKAPELKYQTIAARNAIQFKGAKPKSDNNTNKPGKNRTRFNNILNQCADMLKLMGIACVKGKGEAEALCAHLNEDGMVDGIISQDSDCFAYGGRIVYRNFSISQQGAHAASGGSVEIYNIDRIEKNLNFGRNKIISLALLLGSDYSDGIHGVGRDSTLKLLARYSDREILNRLRSWRDNESLFREFERKVGNEFCTSCGHLGKLQQHNKKGCTVCLTTTGCDFTKFKNERLEIKNELSIRKKALENENFPQDDLINEFLIRKDNIRELDLNWRQPNPINFVKFTCKYLTWEEIYAFEKFLPILTRWQLINYDKLINLINIVHIREIKKVRNPKGVPSFQILWYDRDNWFDNLIPEQQLNDCKCMEQLWTTIEPQNLVENCYPLIVEQFRQSKKKPIKNKKISGLKKQKSTTNLINKDEPKNKKTKSIKKYFKQSTPLKITTNLNNNHYLEILDDSKDDLNLSDIVDSIIEKKVSYDDLIKKKLNEIEVRQNSSFFFESSNVNVDLFEKTMDKIDLSTESDEEIDNLKQFPVKKSQQMPVIDLSFESSDEENLEDEINELKQFPIEKSQHSMIDLSLESDEDNLKQLKQFPVNESQQSVLTFSLESDDEIKDVEHSPLKESHEIVSNLTLNLDDDILEKQIPVKEEVLENVNLYDSFEMDLMTYIPLSERIKNK